MEFDIIDLGLIDFKKAWEFQKDTFSGIKNNSMRSALVLCRHHPVITSGRNAKISNILATNEQLNSRGIGVYQIERGGDITYHGPGQLTVYPIFDLNCFKKDVHFFLRMLEDIIIGSLEVSGIKAGRIPGLSGAWVGGKKIASIGITIKNWITLHGLSINIRKDDLQNFKLIRPCGMDIEMTCAEAALNKNIGMGTIKQEVISNFMRVFQAQQHRKEELP